LNFQQTRRFLAASLCGTVVGTGITVLSICYDDVLRVAREAILKEAGHEVVSAAHLSQALEMLSAIRPGCVILGHTVRLEDQLILALAVEKVAPRPRVVEIYTYRPNPEISPDARLPSHEGPEALIQVLQNLSSASAAAGSE